MANAKISDSSVFLTTVTNVLDIDGFAAYSTSSATGNAAMSGTQLVNSLQSVLDLSSFNTGTLPAARGGTGITNFSDADFSNANVDYSTNGTGILPFAKGGTGVSSFAGSGFVTTSGSAFSYVSSINLASSDVSNVLTIDKGGTGSSTTWKAVQQYAWDGTSTAYTNIPNATDIYLPFNSTALIDESTNSAAATKWVISTTSQGSGPTQQSAFTLGNNGGGIWKIDVFYCSFNMIDFVEGRISLDIDGTIIPIVQRNFGNPSSTTGVIQTLSGSLTYNFSGNEVVKVQIRFDGAGGSGPYPGNTGVYLNRPPEITFTRVI